MGRMPLCAKKMGNTIMSLQHVTVRMVLCLLGVWVADHIQIPGYSRDVAVQCVFFADL